MPYQASPFRPFRPLDTIPIAVPSWDNARNAVLRAVTSSPRLAIITGPAGAGKSTFLRTAAVEAVRSAGWSPIQLLAPVLQDENDTIPLVAAALGLRTNLVDDVLGAVRIGQQETGEVSGSDNVRVTQVFAHSASVAQRAASLTARLAALVAATNRKACFLIDQADSVWLDERASSIATLGAIVDLTTIPSIDVSSIITIRDRHIGSLLLSLRRLGPSVGNIAFIVGLTRDEATEYARSENAASSLGLTNLSLDRAVAEATSADGLVWPVALQSALEQLLQQPRNPDGADLPKSVNSLLAEAVQSRLRDAGPDRVGDMLFILTRLAESAALSGPQSFSDLQRQAPSIPEYDLRIALASLSVLGLIEEVRHDVYAPAHDTLLGAVIELRNGGHHDALVSRLDRAVTDWFTRGIEPDDQVIRLLSERAEGADTPTAHRVMFVAMGYQHRIELSDAILASVRHTAHALPVPVASRIVEQRARRMGRSSGINASELYVVLAIGSDEAATTALMMMRQVFESDQWNESEILPCVVYAANPHLLFAGYSMGFGSMPEAVLRIILTAELQRESDSQRGEVLSALLADRPYRLRGLVLRVLHHHGYDGLAEEALRLVEDENSAIAATALTILVRREIAGWREALRHELDSPNVERRRGAVYCLASVTGDLPYFDVTGLFSRESTALVREAILDVSPDFPGAVVEELIGVALSDQSDIVRESAVYAAANTLEPGIAIPLVEPLKSDSSPIVREALLHLYHGFRHRVPDEMLLRDLRIGSASLRVAAAELIRLAPDTDAWIALADVISDPSADHTLRLAALRTVIVFPHGLVVNALESLLLFTADIEELSCAVDALESVADERSIELVASLIRHDTPAVRERAVYALARLGGEVAIQALISALLDTDAVVQSRAIYGLGRLGVWRSWALIERIPVRTSDIGRAIDWFRSERDAYLARRDRQGPG